MRKRKERGGTEIKKRIVREQKTKAEQEENDKSGADVNKKERRGTEEKIKGQRQERSRQRL